MLTENKRYKGHSFALIGFTIYAGLFCASFLNFWLCFGLFLLLLPLGAVFSRKSPVISVFAIALSAAFLIFGAYSCIFIEPCYELYGKECAVSGEIRDITAPSNDTVCLTISGEAEGNPVKFTVFTNDSGYSCGEKVSLTVRFSQLRDNSSFSERGYYFSRGVFLKGTALTDPQVTSPAPFSVTNAITDYSSYLKGIITDRLSGDSGALLSGIFFGDKSRLSAELKSDIRKCGLSHLVAVSGMHLSLAAGLIIAFLEALGLNRRPRLKFLVALLIICSFMVFFGMTASVRRSGIMLIIYYGAFALRRNGAPLNSIGFALLLILIIEPYACRDAGLFLSVCGSLGAGVLSPKVCKAMIKSRRFYGLKSFVITSVCASLATIPGSAMFFGGFSVISPLSLVLVYPFFFVAIAIMPIFAISGGLFAEALLAPAGAAAYIIGKITALLGKIPYCYTEITGDFFPAFLAVTAAAGIMVYLLCGRKRLIRFSVISLCALFGISCAYRLVNYDNTIITVKSDGENSLILIETKEGITAIASEESEKINAFIQDKLMGSGKDRLLLLAVGGNEEFTAGITDIPCLALCRTDSENISFDVSGAYSVTAEKGVVSVETGGVTILSAPAGTEELSGDITVYSGYRESFGNSGKYVTFLCHKRFYNTEGAFCPYYEEKEIIIDKKGKILMKEGFLWF